jgi:prephenate dehydrogenase
MKKVSVGVIGGTGGMGRWFAALLTKEGCTVFVTGRKTAMTAVDATRCCDVIVVAVPIAATAEVIRRVGPLLTKDKLLMDLTSLKEEPVQLMLQSSPAEVVGCHPLFGPALEDVTGQNVVLCKARGERWYAWVKNILQNNGLSVSETTPREHDKMMAIVQVLNHLNTISLGMALAAADVALSDVDKYSTPIFRTKMEIVKKIFTESPELYADIITQNSDAEKMSGLYKKTLSDIDTLVKSGDGTRLKEALEQAAKKLF